MNRSVFTDNPFIRITLPFIAGIVTGEHVGWTTIIITATIALIVILVTEILITKCGKAWCYVLSSAALFITLVAIGWTTYAINQPAELSDGAIDTEYTFTTTVNEITQRNASTEILGDASIHGKTIAIKISLSGNDYKVRIGDIIACRARISEIRNSSTPDSFDYAGYMKNKGILYEAFVDKELYSTVGHHTSLRATIAEIKANLIQTIRTAGLSSKTAGLAIALFSGDRRYMSPAEREGFSNAGLAHVLAVSGLHIGIIISIFTFLLFPVRQPRYKIVRLLTIMSIVWAYVLFTGAAPSAVRSAIMATFVFVAKDFFKKHSSVNALFSAAFFILLFSPSAIYDAGFQLSFLSVIGILLFSDVLTLRTRFPIVNFIAAAFAVTLSAQLATAPLVVYYFHSFPTCFFLSNLIVVPLLPVFMFLLIAVIIISASGWIVPILCNIVDVLYMLISDFPTFLSVKIPPVSGLWIGIGTTIALTFSVLAIGVSIRYKLKINRVIYFAVLIACITTFTVERMSVCRQGCFVADEMDATNICVYSGHDLYIMNALDDTLRMESFIEYSELFRFKHGIKSIKKLRKTYDGNGIYFSYPFVCVDNKKYMFLEGNYRKNHKPGNPIKVDYAIVTNRFYNGLPDIADYVSADTIIIPRSIYPERRDTLIGYACRHRLNCKFD